MSWRCQTHMNTRCFPPSIMRSDANVPSCPWAHRNWLIKSLLMCAQSWLNDNLVLYEKRIKDLYIFLRNHTFDEFYFPFPPLPYYHIKVNGLQGWNCPPVLPKCGNTKAFMLTRMTVLRFNLVSGLSVKQYKTHLLLTTCLGQNVGRRSFLSTGSARIIIFKMNS